MGKIVLDSNAKINLALDVLGKRDDGYHEINTIMQSIDLSDYLTFESLEKDILTIDSNSEDIPLDEDNLVYKAWEVLRDKYGIKKGAHIYIEKNIPIGAGLAGGSSNAATALKGLSKLWQLDLSLDELIDLGKEIGADVPFCILGGTAQARGIGEKLKALKSFSGKMVLLCNPDIEISSAYAYSLLEVDQNRLDIEGLIEKMEEGDLESLGGLMENKMEAGVIGKYPIIGDIKSRMKELGALGSVMSGGGSTVFGIFDDESELYNAYWDLKEDFDRTYICSTI